MTNIQKIIELILDSLAGKPPKDVEAFVYEKDILNAGLDIQKAEMVFKQLFRDGVITAAVKVWYEANRPMPTFPKYMHRTNLPDKDYNVAVYAFPVNKILLNKYAVEQKFEAAQNNLPSNLLSVKLKNASLIINKNSGDIQLNNFKSNLNPESQEFKFLFRLATSQDYKASYADLLGENPTKTGIRNLTFVVRNLKTNMGILPEKSAENKDIIGNIKKHGYRLIT